MYKHIGGLANTHEQSWIPAVHSMVNTMRPVPVMREPRAVLITRGGSEDLCQSLGAHFIQAENPTKSPLIYQFTSFPLTLPASRPALLIHCGGSSLFVLPSTPRDHHHHHHHRCRSLLLPSLWLSLLPLYQPPYLCKSICCENEACLMS